MLDNKKTPSFDDKELVNLDLQRLQSRPYPAQISPERSPDKKNLLESSSILTSSPNTMHREGNLEGKNFSLELKGQKHTFLVGNISIQLLRISKISTKEETISLSIAMLLMIDVSGLKGDEQEVITNNISLIIDGKTILTEALAIVLNENTLYVDYNFEDVCTFIGCYRYQPFDYFDVHLPIQIPTIHVANSPKSYHINLHTTKHISRGIKYSRKTLESLTEEDLVARDLSTFLFKEDFDENEFIFNLSKSRQHIYCDDVLPKNTPPNTSTAIFEIQFLRKPFYRAATQIMPIIILQVLTLGIFLIDCNGSDEFSNRLSLVATFLVAFYAFIPSVRQDIPPIDYWTLLDVLIVCAYFVIMLVGLQSLLLRYNVSENQNVVFWVFLGLALLIVCLELVIVITLNAKRKFEIDNDLFKEQYPSEQNSLLINLENPILRDSNLYQRFATSELGGVRRTNFKKVRNYRRLVSNRATLLTILRLGEYKKI